MVQAYHALVLNMHQPPGNIMDLMAKEPWEAKQILYCYDRVLRALSGYEDIAHVHMVFSGTLLEQLADPRVQQHCYGTVKLGDMLWSYRNKAIEFLATCYFHPVMPLIPREDWDAQIERWLGLGRHLFDWEHFTGFWPPEMGFCMEMIPVLKRFGFEFVIVDSDYIEPESSLKWEEIRYKPHKAQYDGCEIIVIPRDREFSDAQEAGMDPGWFAYEVGERTRWCDFPPLVTTCTDGDNGGWFRNTSWKGNFWGHFFRPLMDWYREGSLAITPVKIIDYIYQNPPADYVTIKSGSWNTGRHHGHDFKQWTGSLIQRRGLGEIKRVSNRYHEMKKLIQQKGKENHQEIRRLMDETYNYILSSESSCNFFWGSTWVYKSFDALEKAELILDEAARMIELLRK